MEKQAMVTVIACILTCWQSAWAQRPPAEQARRRIMEQRTRIADERVSRQAEVIRLEQMVERLEGRVAKLERALLGTDRFPSLTMIEAEAELRLAESQVAETERRHAEEEASITQVESDRLKLVRARSRLQFAKAARKDRLLELDVARIHAERKLLSETNKMKQLERLLTKGIGAPEGRKLQGFRVEEAQAELTRAMERLELHRRMGSNAEVSVEKE